MDAVDQGWRPALAGPLIKDLQITFWVDAANGIPCERFRHVIEITEVMRGSKPPVYETRAEITTGIYGAETSGRTGSYATGIDSSRPKKSTDLNAACNKARSQLQASLQTTLIAHASRVEDGWYPKITIEMNL